jgi:hypothetical protein
MNKRNKDTKSQILVGLLVITLLWPTVALADSCLADIDHDGKVNGGDMIILNSEMGREDCFLSPCQADLNVDGTVNGEDKKIVQSAFGRYDCPASGEYVDTLQWKDDAGVDVGSDETKQNEVTSGDFDEEEDEREVSLPQTRFIDNGNGTVTDPVNGLMWTKDANLAGDTMLFHQALTYIDEMNEGKHSNFGYADWRLPTQEELRSLIDYTKLRRWQHEIPLGHPFLNVKSINFNNDNVITCLTSTKHSWFVSSYCRLVGHNVRSCYGYVWPVRSES